MADLPKGILQREYEKFQVLSNGEVAVKTVLTSGDIQIGAVEIKDGTTDTRAVVGTNGLEVVPHEVPPTDPTKLNGVTVVSGLSVIGDNLTITDTINGINYRFTTTWTGTGPYTCTVSAVVIV